MKIKKNNADKLWFQILIFNSITEHSNYYVSKEISVVLRTPQQLASTCCLVLPISFVYLHKALERLTSRTILRAKGHREVIPDSCFFFHQEASVSWEERILDTGGWTCVRVRGVVDSVWARLFINPSLKAHVQIHWVIIREWDQRGIRLLSRLLYVMINPLLQRVNGNVLQ